MSRSPSAATIAGRCGFRRPITARSRCAQPTGASTPADVSDWFRQRRAGRDRARYRARCAPRSPSPATAGARTRPTRRLRGQAHRRRCAASTAQDPWSPADAGDPGAVQPGDRALRAMPARRSSKTSALDDFDAQARSAIPQRLCARKVDCGLRDAYPGHAAQLARRLHVGDAFVRNGARRNASRSPRPRRRRSGKRSEQIADEPTRGGSRVMDRLRPRRAALSRGRPRRRAQRRTRPTSPVSSPAPPDCPQLAFPVGLDARGMPVGLELLGRPHSDEALVAMMAAIEVARGPLPSPRRSAAGGRSRSP